MLLNKTPLGRGGALLIEPKVSPAAPAPTILDVPGEAIWPLFDEAGLLLFRGFAASPARMRAFSERFSTGYNVLSPGRPMRATEAGFVQVVDPGMEAVELHRENGFFPLQPDLVWFCCGTPARAGGQTTYCDGVELWDALSPATRALFEARQVVGCAHDVPVAHFQAILGPDATVEMAAGLLDAMHGAIPQLNARVRGLEARGWYTLNPEGTFEIRFACSAVIGARRSGRLAFASHLPLYLASMRAARHGRGFPISATFEDGDPIPAGVVEEVMSRSAACTGEIAWQAGDLAMVDNSRYMHGRRAFDDPGRELFSLVTYCGT